MQVEVAEGQRDGFGERPGGEAAALMRRAHPVADRSRLQGAAGHAVEVEPADDLGTVDDDQWHHGALGISTQRRLQDRALTVYSEPFVVAQRIPWREEIAM